MLQADYCCRPCLNVAGLVRMLYVRYVKVALIKKEERGQMN